MWHGGAKSPRAKWYAQAVDATWRNADSRLGRHLCRRPAQDGNPGRQARREGRKGYRRAERVLRAERTGARRPDALPKVDLSPNIPCTTPAHRTPYLRGHLLFVRDGAGQVCSTGQGEGRRSQPDLR